MNESKLVKIQPKNFDERNLDNELVKGSKVDKRILDIRFLESINIQTSGKQSIKRSVHIK